MNLFLNYRKKYTIHFFRDFIYTSLRKSCILRIVSSIPLCISHSAPPLIFLCEIDESLITKGFHGHQKVLHNGWSICG